jgi:hypothetical protein
MPKLPKLKSLVPITILALLLLFAPAQQGALARAQSSDEPANSFSEAVASKLLGQVTEGLQAHMARKMLGAFDLARMDQGSLFKDQVTAFFNESESIRVHFKLVEVKGNTVTVDAQMEVTRRSSIDPPEHKSIQLRFTAEQISAGWKFVDVQPRAFFS